MIEGSATPIPFTFWQAGILLKKVHGYWQVAIRVPTYTNPDNFFGLGVGYALDFVLGQNRLLKLPAVPFFVGTRVLDLFEQEDCFRKSCRHWKDGVKGVHPITLVEHLNGTYKLTWYLQSKRILIRIQRVAMATFGVVKEGFNLLMRIMDVLELITFDSKRLQELVDLSVREGAINISRCLKALHRNKGALIQRLHGNRDTINRLLRQLGARKTKAEDVVALAEAGIEKLQDWTSRYEAIGQVVGNWVKGRQEPQVIVPPREIIKVPQFSRLIQKKPL